MAAVGRPPFVWMRPDTQDSRFAKVPLQGVLDVADLAAAAAKSFSLSASSLGLILVAPPGPEPPLAAISTALLRAPLSVTAELASEGIAPGCWMLARVSISALSAALASAAQDKAARLAAEANAAQESAARVAAEAARGAAEAAAPLQAPGAR